MFSDQSVLDAHDVHDHEIFPHLLTDDQVAVRDQVHFQDRRFKQPVIILERRDYVFDKIACGGPALTTEAVVLDVVLVNKLSSSSILGLPTP